MIKKDKLYNIKGDLVDKNNNIINENGNIISMNTENNIFGIHKNT